MGGIPIIIEKRQSMHWINPPNFLSNWLSQEKFQGQLELPLPDYYGGYRLIPEVMEFWQGGGKNFRQDRIRYKNLNGKEWVKSYLAP